MPDRYDQSILQPLSVLHGSADTAKRKKSPTKKQPHIWFVKCFSYGLVKVAEGLHFWCLFLGKYFFVKNCFLENP